MIVSCIGVLPESERLYSDWTANPHRYDQHDRDARGSAVDGEVRWIGWVDYA